MSLITLADYKIAKKIEVADYDEQLGALLAMVESAILKYCGRTFAEATYTEKREGIIDSRGFYVFYMDNRPVSTVNSVELKFFGVTTGIVLDVTKLDIFEDKGVAYYAAHIVTDINYIRPEHMQDIYYIINYTAGYATTPVDVKFAVIDALSDTFNYYYGDGIAIGETTPSGEVKEVEVGDYRIKQTTTGEKLKLKNIGKEGTVFNSTVKSLLNPYKLTGQST